jgi:hypothetical protein
MRAQNGCVIRAVHSRVWPPIVAFGAESHVTQSALVVSLDGFGRYTRGWEEPLAVPN